MGIDKTGLDLLDTLSWIANSVGFVGIISSQLVLANGFDLIRKVGVHNGKVSDMRRLQISKTNFYYINGSATEIIKMLANVYSKTMEVDDNNWINEFQHLKNMQNCVLSDVPYLSGHEYRLWEYAIAINYLRLNKYRNVLNVHGNASIFGPASCWQHIDILTTTVDPGSYESWIEHQNNKLGWQAINYIKSNFFDFESDIKYDGVVCFSVLNRIEDDEAFFKKMLKFVKLGGCLFLTVEFHPSGLSQGFKQLRTYNVDSIDKFIRIAAQQGFQVDGATDYAWRGGAHVNTYTLASLALKKIA